MEQLAYTMLVQALRLHLTDATSAGPGWLTALSDKHMTSYQGTGLPLLSVDVNSEFCTVSKDSTVLHANRDWLFSLLRCLFAILKFELQEASRQSTPRRSTA